MIIDQTKYDNYLLKLETLKDELKKKIQDLDDEIQVLKIWDNGRENPITGFKVTYEMLNDEFDIHFNHQLNKSLRKIQQNETNT